MLTKEHPVFPSLDSQRTIWRYMDFTKFVSLLENKKLFFPRADSFEDPYEGTLTRATVHWMLNAGIPAGAVDHTVENTNQWRQQVFVSCWCANDHESAAMWKLYLQTSEGVAIKSKTGLLATELDRSPLSVSMTSVNYIDYDLSILPPNNIFYPFVHKRLSFQHETEIRALIWSKETANLSQIPENAASVSIDVSLQDLVEAVYVSPTAPPWFGELVEQITKRYGLDVLVVKSNLYMRPVY
ncbi:MAG TPA: hypothetical protein VNZ27_01290 [Rhodanobacter sp.]|jgi:hypothetical protein|nr:hypothetical protein [Rhodanobacter sp.]